MGDPLREVPLRFLGHGAAAAEALRWDSRIDSKLIDACRAVGGMYIVGHSIMAALGSSGDKMIFAAIDVLIFDLLASVAIPFFLVQQLSGIAHDLICNIDGLPRMFYDWFPLLIGLLIIAAGYKMIDGFVDDMMEITVRQLY